MHIFGHIETLSCQIKTLCLLNRELPMPIKPNDAQFMIVPTRDMLGTNYHTHGTPWNATQMQLGPEIHKMGYNARKIDLKLADYVETERQDVRMIRFG